MVESDLNTILVRSLNLAGGETLKIPDPSLEQIMRGTKKLPCDIIGTHFDGTALDIESKLIKPDTKSLLSSFKFDRIEDHQFKHMRRSQAIIERTGSNALALYAIGYWRSRTLFVVFFFDVALIHKLVDSGVTSLKGKDMQKLYDKGLFLPISKKQMNAKAIREKTIRELPE